MTLALFVATNASVIAQGLDPAAILDTYAAEATKKWEIPGLAIGVVQGGEVVLANGYGVRTLDLQQPVDEHTLFAIGSTTKAMTAATVLMLQEDGVISLEDPVSDHLPAFELSDPYAAKELTLRDLLLHRAGLPNADFLWYGQDNARADILRRMRLVEPSYSFRDGFIYQNIMYAAAGEVVSAASGMSWESFVQSRVFKPLGMTRTIPSLPDLRRTTNIAAPHARIGGSIEVIENEPVDSVAPAGAVWSSVADMARWLAFFLSEGEHGGEPLLSPTGIAELLRPQVFVGRDEFYPTWELTKPHFVTYGLGWFQQDYQGRFVCFHTGSIDGMSAIVGLVPDEDLGIVVLANLDHAEARHALLWKAIDLFGGVTDGRDWSAELFALYAKRAQGWQESAAAIARTQVSGTTPSHSLAEYVGTYHDDLMGDVEVTLVDGNLRMVMGPRLVADLTHWHYDTFVARWQRQWRGSAYVLFGIGADGSIASVEVRGRKYARRPSEKGS